MSTNLTSAQSTLVAALVAKFESKISDLVEKGVITNDSGVMTHFNARVEYPNGDAEWVTSDGQLHVTKSSRPGFDRPLAPVIPSSFKKLAKDGPDTKTLDKARVDIRKAVLGFFALMETSIVSKSAPRTLPGIAGKQYSTNREVAEMQKYGDAGEKIGL
jgi:hypothetical protein